MNLPEIKALIKSKIRHLYDAREAEAIARGYISDKLQTSLLPGSPVHENLKIPDFFETDMDLLAKGTPLQYVTGIQHFAGKIFKVSNAVLIPRPETEELVEWVIADLKARTHHEQVTIIDIGTGSGCIPVMLKLTNPSATVHATDISAEALKVAEENAIMHQVRVEYHKDDILNPTFSLPEEFDIIISNPPYIPLSESHSLAVNVLNFEPHSALFASDKNPIIFYEAITNYAVKHLKKNGHIYFEIHPGFALQLADHLANNGFKNVICRNDLSGHQRFLKATLMKTK